ncbi:hypothetical protein BDN72DRAFT_725460, partial [Pluteus cervinus]
PPPSVFPLPTSSKPRKPNKDKFISNNAHRPHVLARERLQLWSTPYSLRQRQSVNTSLPPPLAQKVFETIHNAHAPSTKGSYGAGLLRFNQFCDRHNISEEDRMPASHILLVAFVADHQGQVSGKTIKLWLSSIRAWHEVNHADWNGEDRWVQFARTSANKLGTHHRRPQRGPITIQHLHTIRNNLDLSSPKGAAYWAITLTAFWGCRRLGELTTPSLSNFDPLQHVARSTHLKFKTLPDGTTSVSFLVPWTKTKKQEGGRVVLTGRDDDLCPVTAIRNHLKINNSAPLTSHLFSYCNNSRLHTFSLPAKPPFLDFLTKTVQSNCNDTVFGHSLRIGGSVELLLAGVSPEVVASIGEWTSLAFLLYWRKLEDLIPRSISSAYHKKSLNDVVQAFEAFRVKNNIPKNIS